MSYIREVQLLKEETQADAGTKTVDLNILDPITQLFVVLKVVNTAAVCEDLPPHTQLSSIELVDGGQTYMSMSGAEAIAAACYDSGKYPPHFYDENDSAEQSVQIPIYFGRYPGDPEFALMATRLRNPQIKVTWTNHANHLANYTKLGVWARVMEGAPVPPKCLLWKRVESWVTAASGDHVTELWTDYPIRRMLIRAYYTAGYMATTLNNLKLNCDAGKLILFDHSGYDFQHTIRTMFDLFHVHKLDKVDNSGEARTWLAGICTVELNPNTANCVAHGFSSQGERYTQSCVDVANAGLTDIWAWVRVTGEFPHSAWCYQFGRPDDPDSWFDAPGYGDIKLISTQGRASASASVLVQQPRSLP